VLRSDTTLIGAMLLKRGYVDAMLCGVVGRHAAAPQAWQRRDRPGARRHCFAAMNMLLLPKHTLFLCDTYVNENPTPSNWPRSR
jgi:malate dehydrogenase (oxaloacetate-decarboxylating)(NADP+)